MTNGIDMGPDPDKVVLVGDAHHDTDWMLSVIEHAKSVGADTLVQLGDFGYWPGRVDVDRHYLYRLGRALGGDMRLYWIDGNRENHDLLVPGLRYGPIQHLPRGLRWRWWDRTWMAVGGAVSSDKRHNTRFGQEALTDEQVDFCCRPGGVDVIVSHDAPDRVDIPYPRQKAEYYSDEAIAASEAHRKLIGRIVDATGARWVFHGHHHIGYTAHRDQTIVVGLAGHHDGELDGSVKVLTREDI